MEVIKNNDVERIHKCENCRSIYTYKPSEVDYDWTPSMKCPVCKSINHPSIFDRKIKK